MFTFLDQNCLDTVYLIHNQTAIAFLKFSNYNSGQMHLKVCYSELGEFWFHKNKEDYLKHTGNV